ncbi:hypothetical protein M0E87_01105 [Corynebacterium sp. CCM 9185]|uniref:FG-GAP repeat protein n=1 Tax=Corynebacterium marambiense TaxID=2765364 RepID=A0ABS0VRS1_9CORY|nr:hypothetical protein [Corynebacterium marambiense]MBI8999432.1 hypothetical protein [Corynebacterium marambiense]MCK7662270.1 hypothetical protein [Corynebacterium marambiense]
MRKLNLAIVFFFMLFSISGCSDLRTGGIGSEDRGAARPVSYDDLIGAEVPPLCGNPGGEMVDGQLDHMLGGRAHVGIVGSYSGENLETGGHLVIGDMNGDGIDDGVIDVTCATGTVMWPSTILVYTDRDNFIGQIDRSINRISRSGSAIKIDAGRGGVKSMYISDEVLTVYWDGYLDGDPSCCPSVPLVGEVKVRDGVLSLENVALDRAALEEENLH